MNRKGAVMAAVGCLLWTSMAGTARAEKPPEEANTTLAPGTNQTTGSSEARKRWKKRWIASWLAMAAAEALDTHSSLGRREANPLLRNRAGRFDLGRALLIKSAMSGGFLALQAGIARAQPRRNPYRPFTIVNAAMAGGLAATAVHNYSLPAPPAKSVPAHLAPQP